MGTELFDLTGKSALVTGGGKGIGRAIASGLAGAGAKVAVLGRNRDALESAVDEIRKNGGTAIAIQGDVTDAASVEGAIGQVAREFGCLDILVNSAGAQITGPSTEVTEEDWDTVVDANLKGTFLCCQAAARHFLQNGGGKIVNMASTFSFAGFPGFAAYCASKGGVLLLTRALATEWADKGINVNAIAPCATRTELNAYLMDDPDFLAGFLPRFPAGRTARPEDMVGAAIYLSSRASDMVHGQALLVDGGYTAI